jgi:hypothetical protein
MRDYEIIRFIISVLMGWLAFAGQKVFSTTDPAGTPLVMTDEKEMWSEAV